MKRKSRRGSSHLHQRKATVRPAGTTLHPSGTSGVMRCEGAADFGRLFSHAPYMEMICLFIVGKLEDLERTYVYADDMIIYCE